MKRIILNVLKFLTPTMPPLDEYGIPKRPRRNVPVDETRTTKTRVVGGKAHAEHIDADGHIVTTIGKQPPKTVNEIEIDGFDSAMLDFVVGVKWKKDHQRAAIMKWHWVNEHSARQIEIEHTDKQTGKLESGFSERTAAGYIRAFYDADDQRAERGLVRLRPPREAKISDDNTVDW